MNLAEQVRHMHGEMAGSGFVKAWGVDSPHEELDYPRLNRISFDLHFEPNSTNTHVGLRVVITPRPEEYTYWEAEFKNLMKTFAFWVKDIKLEKRHYDSYPQNPDGFESLGSLIMGELDRVGDDLVKQGTLKAPNESAGRFRTEKFKLKTWDKARPGQYAPLMLVQEWHTQEEMRAANRLLCEQRYARLVRVVEIEGSLTLLQRQLNNCEAEPYDYYEERDHFWKRQHNLRLLECKREINDLQGELKTIKELLREPIEMERDRKQELEKIGQYAMEVLKNGA